MSDHYTTADFMGGISVRYWDDQYAEELLSKYFAVESGFGSLL